MNEYIDSHARTIIHIDLDCFYAQVEMNKNPALRTLPLGIQQKNIVVTSNYAARKHGITKCMQISEAKKACPNLVLVKGEDLYEYRQVSYKVTALLQKYSKLVERLGFDENYLDVTRLVAEKQANGKIVDRHCDTHTFGDISDMCDCGCRDRLNIGSVIADEIRSALKVELSLTSCAGIAHNKLLAKLAGAKNKPNQQTIVYPNSALELMNSLELSNIPGIGAVLQQQLNNLNIKTTIDLQSAELSRVQSEIGSEKAQLIYDLSYGIDKTSVKSSGRPQSIGIEDSCRSISVEREVRDKLRQLLYRLLILMRDDGRLPKTLKLTVRKLDSASKMSHRESRQCNVNSNLFNLSNICELSPNNENKLLTIVMQLFAKLINVQQQFHITLLGLAFTKFCERRTSIRSFFTEKDIQVHSIINIENATGVDNGDNSNNFPSSSLSNLDSPDDKEKDEPNSKRSKLTALPSTSNCNNNVCLLVKRRHLESFSDDECSSPSKLRVAELNLSPEPSACSSSIEIKCPPGYDVAVFKELPIDVQQELWNDFKSQEIRKNSVALHQCKKKFRPNTILNYVVKNN